MAEKTEDPKGVAGPPVRFVTVEDAGGLGGDPVPGAEFGEHGGLDVVADRVVLQVTLPVDVDGSGQMPHVVQEDILVALDDPDPLVLQVVGHPFRGDKGFGVGVVAVDAHVVVVIGGRHPVKPAGMPWHQPRKNSSLL